MLSALFQGLGLLLKYQGVIAKVIEAAETHKVESADIILAVEALMTAASDAQMKKELGG